ncbi:MAG: hypothetical protein QY302_14680 [Anaerolineales bacterium]|nr:MAG: hypothetical protein QY302_14680 [Anaerolineales bacterium]
MTDLSMILKLPAGLLKDNEVFKTNLRDGEFIYLNKLRMIGV